MMQVHRVVSPGRAARAQWWQEQAQRVLSDAGFEPYVSELFVTDQSTELDLVRELPVPLVLDVVECDQLVSGREGEQAEITIQAILREEGFHARDFARLSELPEAQWHPHVNRAGQILNHSGLLSFLQT